MSLKDRPYRPCAGLLVLNRAGHAFIGRRIGGPEHVDNTHVWQMPQGGIDAGEDPWPAALRELREETSMTSYGNRPGVRTVTPVGAASSYWRRSP